MTTQTEIKSGKTYRTIMENGEETDLLCRRCECLYWQCEHEREIVAEYEQNKKWFRCEATVLGMPKTFVDWYRADSVEHAERIWRAEAIKYGLPMKRTTVSTREATARETEIFNSPPTQ
jgi:hypothetical protein